ncbi:hypothetical protein Leryth_007719 [Lithospermum erythrorhizon]|uniref:DUF7054 domain-containing protein n=1 Tax=Lithospermum erythrorhizon TaxID=34254 RepID=A0AAV3QM00_LITER|nr:hypothetical protein Leryth_007719 [Lithospermum erythrorhizon]
MLLYKQKKNQGNKGGNRLLITVTVLGSPGPLRFVVKEEELVESVVDMVLKSYHKEGRVPVLGSDLNSFVLYSPNNNIEALRPLDTIGSFGVRNFSLCKKPQKAIDDGKSPVMSRKTSSSWKSWLNKSLNLKISSH